MFYRFIVTVFILLVQSTAIQADSFIFLKGLGCSRYLENNGGHDYIRLFSSFDHDFSVDQLRQKWGEFFDFKLINQDKAYSSSFLDVPPIDRVRALPLEDRLDPSNLAEYGALKEISRLWSSFGAEQSRRIFLQQNGVKQKLQKLQMALSNGEITNALKALDDLTDIYAGQNISGFYRNMNIDKSTISPNAIKWLDGEVYSYESLYDEFSKMFRHYFQYSGKTNPHLDPLKIEKYIFNSLMEQGHRQSIIDLNNSYKPLMQKLAEAFKSVQSNNLELMRSISSSLDREIEGLFF